MWSEKIITMQSLLDTIKKVRDKISAYEADLKRSEALTRYVLIDPILRALGWDLERPELVRPEFATETGTPDYALLINGRPHVMIEVKSLKGNLEAAKDKGFNYCWKNRVPYYVITDGETWELYDMSKMGGERIFSINISKDNPGHVARQLLALWLPAMPIIRPSPKSVIPPPRPKLTLDNVFRNVKAYKGKRPKRVFLSDGREARVNYWYDVLAAIVKWFAPELEARLPIKLAKRVILSKSKIGIERPIRIDGLWLHKCYSIKSCLRYSRRILKLVGKSLQDVYIEF